MDLALTMIKITNSVKSMVLQGVKDFVYCFDHINLIPLL